MNAQEARQKAISITLNTHNSQLVDVNKCIKEAVERGQLSVSYGKTLGPVVIAELHKRGFKTEIYSDFKENYITITW